MTSKSEKRLQSGKVALTTAIITSVTTILVAFIGIFQQLRRADANDIADLETTLENLGHSVGEDWDISGSVVDENGQPFSAEIYLMPQSGTFSDYTDDNGGFHFDNIPSQTYSILVRKTDPEVRGESRKILVLEPETSDSKIDTTIEVTGAVIKYTISFN